MSNTGLAWRKASRSATEGQCVEVAALQAAVAVRDSKNPYSGALLLPGGQWRALLATVKAGDHDLA